MKRSIVWNKAKESEEPSKIAAGAKFSFALLALAVLCVCVTAQENTSGYWIERAEELSQNSSFVEASNAYEKALQIEPDNTFCEVRGGL